MHNGYSWLCTQSEYDAATAELAKHDATGESDSTAVALLRAVIRAADVIPVMPTGD